MQTVSDNHYKSISRVDLIQSIHEEWVGGIVQNE